jgi:hypothetical protein
VKKAKFASMKTLSVIFSGLLIAYLVGCQSEPIDFTNDDTVNLQNEVSSDAYSGDAYDISHLAVGSSDATYSGREANGRKITYSITDALKRFDCATITLETASDNALFKPKGTITIDFGSTGCKDAKGNLRKGKIIVVYAGKRYNSNSTITTTFDGYQVNGIKNEGTLSVSYSNLSTGDKVIFTEKLTDGKVTWPDGTTAIRTENKTIEWTRNALEPIKDQWKIYTLYTAGTTYTAAGINRKGVVYEMKITEPLVYKRECIITSKGTVPVKGIKELLVSSKKITADYGDGTCDREVTITIKGKSKLVELKSDI